MLIGHQRQWQFLTSAARAGRLAHAYIFFGPGQVGKRTVAQTFVQWACCEDASAKPCGFCPSCRHILAWSHPDVFFLTPQRKANSLFDRPRFTIEQIRDVRPKLFLSPSLAAQKFIIIDEAEALGAEAANALLKILEEPASATHFFMIAASPHALLPTIRSRAQHLWFSPVPEPVIANGLAKQYGLAEDAAAKLARHAFGLPGRAISLSAKPETVTKEQEEFDEFLRALERPIPDRYAYIESFPHFNQSSFLAFLDTLANFARFSYSAVSNSFLPSLFVARKLVSGTNISPRSVLEMLLLKQL